MENSEFFFIQSLLSLEQLSAEGGLKTCLHKIVEQCFALYDKNPLMARMILWQRLDKNFEKLKEGAILFPEKWHDTFHSLQKQGQIRSDWKIEIIILWIIVSMSGVFLMSENPFQNELQKQAYKKMIIEGLWKSLVSDKKATMIFNHQLGSWSLVQ